MVRKLHQINESVDGYEPEGREFESLRARHSTRVSATYPLKTAPPCYQFATQGNVYSRSRCRVETPAEAGRSIICGMVKPFIQPVRRRRGNPNWGRPLPPAPAVPTEFETQVRHLGLTKQTCTRSVALRNWCERNKNRCYIPEWLLEEWGIAVEPYVSGAA